MSKNYNYYLARTHRGFYYARGEAFEIDIKGLALVRIDEYKDLDFKGDWAIIDVDSGLYLFRALTRKRVLEIYQERFEGLCEAIERSRSTDGYKKRVQEAEIERKNWKESGYRL